MLKRRISLEAQLKALLGRDAKDLLKKIDTMLADKEKKTRKEIERMIAEQMARYMKQGLKRLPT